MAPSATSRSWAWEVNFLIPVLLLSFSLSAILLSLRSPSVPVPLQTSTPVPATGEQPKATLQLKLATSNAFTLAIFSDLHFGEQEHGWGIGQDINSTRVMNSVLDSEDAIDLVVLNGDLITGENTFKENSSDYIYQIVNPMQSRNIPWASTYGNHDSKFNLSREAIFQAEKKFELSLTQRMDPSLPGLTNYYLLVHDIDDHPVAIIWFFDSRGGSSYQENTSGQDDIPNWVADETAQWFTSTSQQIRSQYGPLPSIAFVHIPPHPYLLTQQNGLDTARFPGLNEDVPLSIQGEGHDDDVFVTAMEQDDSLHSIYVGHDHGDSWCGVWPSASTRRQSQRRRPHDDDGDDDVDIGDVRGGDSADRAGPFLCFSRHTGYGGYGEWDRGARIVQLSFQDLNDDGTLTDEGEMSVDTWVRMESGDTLTRVTLNETYGTDRYT